MFGNAEPLAPKGTHNRGSASRTERRIMDNDVTIIMESNFAQPELLSNVVSIEIKRDNVKVCGRGYTKIYFKDKIKSMTCSSNVKVYIR